MGENMNVVFYEGSNTVPNCAENVNWYLFRDSRPASTAVVDAFKAWTNNKNFNDNLE